LTATGAPDSVRLMSATIAAAPRDQAAIDWLLASDEPEIRMQARRDLLDEASPHVDAAAVLEGQLVGQLFSGQRPDGGFGTHPYRKWDGAHWRLVSLVELGVPAAEPRALAAAETVLDWLTGRAHRSRIATIDGRTRRCASQEGNALAVCSRLGMADDPRVALLAESLIGWQWPDGGWNCDRTPSASHSSFYETRPPMWGLAEFARATGDAGAASAARRAAEFFLQHRLFRSHTTGEVADPKWLELRYPEYWHYDYLHGLVMLARAGVLPDPRAQEAVSFLREQQHDDGTWHAAGSPYWRRSEGVYWDPAQWERSGPNRMLTLHALRVLSAAA
jgi:hypothetical protein